MESINEQANSTNNIGTIQNKDVLSDKERGKLEHCEGKLKNLLNQSMFKSEFEKVYHYYYYLLNKKVRQKGLEEELFSNFYEYCTTTLFQGYYIGYEFLNTTDILVKDSYFEQPDGVIKQQIPDQLEIATNGLLSKLEDSNTKKFEEWILKHNKNLQNTLDQIKKDLACLGARYSFFDERIERNIEVRKRPKYGMLHRPDDFIFLDPQKFATCVIANDSSEVWDIHWWSTIKAHESKLGEIQIVKFKTDETDYAYSNFVYYQGMEFMKSVYDKVLITIKVGEFVPEKEITVIQAFVVEQIARECKVPFENINLNITIYTTNKSLQYNPSQFE